jgi:TP901 family phage tail tape measure protein
MIETTREAPENLGTAMKTIIARFQEMKQDPTKLVDSEGVAMDANKIDTALKTIGVDLTNQKGEFRDLDDVFLDISAKWDSLTQGQQRYIATIAAGSRQQSRFIAMMQNHERVMELVEAANNSAGASQKQFEKTLDSMSSKLNRLKNAWNQFTMGLMNDKLIKGGTDALTKSFTIINKIIDFLGKIPPKPFEGITKSALTLATTLGMLNIGKKMTRGTVMGVAGWWKQEGGFIKNFKQGYGAGEINKVGQETAKGFSTAFSNHFKKEGSSLIPNAIASSIVLMLDLFL